MIWGYGVLKIFVLLVFLPSLYAIIQFPSPSLQIFFYAWYGAPPHDVGYLHWTHSVLPHWTEHITNQHRKEPYIAPGDPGITFYPQRGLYSSHDPITLNDQMRELKEMEVDVVIVSWWGQKHKNSSVDGQGVGSDHSIPSILDAASKHNISIAFHLEPYPLRSEYSVRDDLEYIMAQYGNHSALYRHPITLQPLMYVYDAYHMTKEQWKKLLKPDGSMTIRNTTLDCIMIGLVLDDLTYLVDGGFDGAYSYFAAEGFTQASTSRNWQRFRDEADQRGLLFIPSVAPGYDDTRLRPWNSINTRPRRVGAYYDEMFGAALSITPPPSVITITSFNEWGEGTQIEPARPFVTDHGESLAGYGEVPEEGEQYAELYYIKTKNWAQRWKEPSNSTGSQQRRHQDLDGDDNDSHTELR